MSSSMEDILKILAASRQQSASPQQANDPMSDLIGGLLGSMQPTQQASSQPDMGDIMGLLGALGGGQPAAPANQPSTNLGGMMSLLEMFMGGGGSGLSNQGGNPLLSANNPIMGLLQPFVKDIAKKLNIPPEIAMVVVTFVVHKLLSHHPTSQRDSNSFDLDNMLSQMNSGKIDPAVLHKSGMVQELSKKTGLDEATAAKSLEMTFNAMGKQLGGRSQGKVQTTKSAPAKGKLGGGVKSSKK